MVAEQIAILTVSLLVLARSAQVLNDKAIVLARFFKIGEAAIGFLLLSVATSLPELAISIMAALKGESSISVGNVLGANTSDLTLVLGISALLGTVAFTSKETRKLAKILLLASAIPIVILALNFGRAWSPALAGIFEVLNSITGIGLLACFAAYAYFVLREEITEDYGEKVTAKQAVSSAFFFSIALFFLVASSNLVVDSAIMISELMGLSKSVVAATIISLGTTLPELTVTAIAVRGKHKELGIGNAIGSCIVNLTLILGTSAVLNPLAANLTAFMVLVFFYLGAVSLLWYLVLKRGRIGRGEAAILLGYYATFVFLSTQIRI